MARRDRYPSSVPVATLARRIVGLPLTVYYGLDHLIRELMKFGVVGSVAFLVDTAVNNGLRQTSLLDDKPLTAKIASATIATVVAFAGNRYWTFRHRNDPGLARGFGLFAFLNLVGIVIAIACLGLSHYVLGFDSLLADNISGNVIGTGLGTLFRFWSYRKWVFTDTPAATPAATQAPLEVPKPATARIAGSARIPGQAAALPVEASPHP